MHRSRGTDHQVPGLYRFWCSICDGASIVGCTDLATAIDAARYHLIHAHHFLALARRLRTQHGRTP